MTEKILITAALPYVNNNQHLGHIVGCHLPADIFARYCKIQGKTVAFVGGSDAHGTPIAISARKQNILPNDLANKYHLEHRKELNWFNINYDYFGKTNCEEHKRTTLEFFELINKNGFLKIESSVMPYCEHDKMFLPDRYIEGICPKCKGKTNGDQCDCGYVIKSPKDLINPKCVLCGNAPIFKETKHLFIELDKLEPDLKKWIESKKEIWSSLVYSIAKSWLDKGLKPRAISRDLDWGIKIPLDGFEDKVFYVWFDAPIGYVTFTKNVRGFEDAWTDKNIKIYHFLGKDNIPFHSIFWPGSLLGTRKYRLPDEIIGFSYLNYENNKFSKSKNIGIFLPDAMNSDLDPDYWRFYLSYILPENGDSNWDWNDFDEKINRVLVGKLSNFIHRTLTLIKKNNYIIPKKNETSADLINKRDKIITEYHQLMDKVKLREGLRKAMDLVELSNTYLQESEPWKKEDQSSLFHCANLCVDLAKLFAPFMPEFSKKVQEMLNTKDFKDVVENSKINEPKIIFTKINIDDLKNKIKGS